MSEYECISTSGFKEEKAFKINFIELIKKENSLLKANKIKHTHIENEIVNSDKIDIIGFNVLCLFYKLNVIIIKNKTFYEFLYGENEKIHILHWNNKKYGIEHITSTSNTRKSGIL